MSSRIKYFFIIQALLIIFSRSYSETNDSSSVSFTNQPVFQTNNKDKKITEESLWSKILINTTAFIPSAFLYLNFHEIGHVTTARLLGDDTASYSLFVVRPNGSVALGLSHWDDSKLSPLSQDITMFSGVLFSRGLAEMSDMAVKNMQMPLWFERFFSITYLLGRTDYTTYVLKDFTIDLFHGFQDYETSADIHQFVAMVSGKDVGTRVGVYSVLLALAGLDVYFDWNRIKFHWDIIAGNNSINPSAVSDNLEFRFLDDDKLLSLTARF